MNRPAMPDPGPIVRLTTAFWDSQALLTEDAQVYSRTPDHDLHVAGQHLVEQMFSHFLAARRIGGEGEQRRPRQQLHVHLEPHDHFPGGDAHAVRSTA